MDRGREFESRHSDKRFEVVTLSGVTTPTKENQILVFLFYFKRKNSWESFKIHVMIGTNRVSQQYNNHDHEKNPNKTINEVSTFNIFLFHRTTLF